MSQIRVNFWAEGPTDRAAARKIIEAVGGVPGEDYSRCRGAIAGKSYLDTNLPRFNSAARFAPWLVLRDGDGECAKQLIGQLLPEPAPLMRFRIVVPAIEAWLLADREALAQFLRVNASNLPAQPEQLADVKQCMIDVARRSSIRSVREEFPPVPRSGRRQGPGYASHLIRFIDSSWVPKRARENAPSLRRTLKRLSSLLRRTD